MVMSNPFSLQTSSTNLAVFQSAFFCFVVGESLECSDDMLDARFLKWGGVTGHSGEGLDS